MNAQAFRNAIALVVALFRSHLTAPRSIREVQAAASRELMLEVTIAEAREIQGVLAAKGFRDGDVPAAVFTQVCEQVIL